MFGKKVKKPKRKGDVDDDDEEEEREIIHNETAPDGKWGWFVVFCSFICNMIVDGVQYTFANFLLPIAATFDSNLTRVSLIGSLLSGFYNFSGPIAGALGNKFGFRMVVITGSLVSAGGLIISYFAPGVGFLYFFYGVLGGLGFGMIYMASVITTSIYFEKYRALAASLSVCGTGVGTFVFAPLGNWLVVDYGWRLALVVEGVIILLCIFCGWSFKPLEIITVMPISKEPSDTSTSTTTTFRHGSIYYPTEGRKTLPNEAYPTLKEALFLQDDRRSTVVSIVPKTRRTSTLESIETSRQVPIYSIVASRESLDKYLNPTKKYKFQRCCRVFCFNFWHCRCKQKELTLGDRPMYRDDIFYEGSLTRLPAYTSSERINYHLSVTRIPDPQEVEEHMRQKCCVCHHAFLRTCVTMTGLNLLKSKIFAFLCVSSFMYTMSLYVPYVFIRKLAIEYEVSDDIAIWLVSAIGICNTAGRLASGIVKSLVKINAALFAFGCLTISGIYSFVFLFAHDLGTLVSFSCVFGFFTAPFISLRPVIIVEFLGLEKLTNAFGLVLLSQGVASIIGPPIAGLIEEGTGNCVYVIYLSGSLMLGSAMTLLVSTMLAFQSKRKQNEEELNSINLDERERTNREEPKKEEEAEWEDEEKDGENEDKEEQESENKEEQENENKEENYAIIPPNGGWGWLVVACAFYCNVVVDGIQLTFGVFLKTISDSLKAEHSSVALAGSLMFGVHLLMGPICTGFSNVFGLRPTTITGSLICCFGVGLTYFANGYWYLCFTYGVIGGMGLGLVYMNSLIITSMYFTTLMPIAIAIVVCGTGVGTMVFAALGNSLLRVTTWQNSFLMQAALAGSMGLAAITFKPLKPIRVRVTQSASNVIVEPVKSDYDKTSRRGAVFIKRDLYPRGSVASIRDINNLTWNGLLEEVVAAEIKRKRCCDCHCPSCKKRYLDAERILILSEIENPFNRRKSYVEKERSQSIAEDLSPEGSSTSFKSIFTKVEFDNKSKSKPCDPLKRTLTATLDCHLLKSCSFFLFTISGALQMAALLIVFTYEKDRCTELGFTEEMSVYFVISLGGANMIWRLLLGGLATIPKINYHVLAISGIVIGGIATMCSGLNSSVYYQFGFCIFFGLGMASFAVFRLVLLVELVEPELIGNATGINLLFMGVLCIISPPLFGWAMETTKSYNVIFLTTGFLLSASGLMLTGLHKLRKKELAKLNR